MKYSYEITRVDEEARVMDVVYTHETHGSILVGVRLPFEGENLEKLIKSFSPAAYWKELELPVVIPEVGKAGEINDVPVNRILDNEVIL